MGWDSIGNWDPFDDLTALPLNTEVLDMGEREVPSAPSYDFNGEDAPQNVFARTDTGHTDSATVWYPERRELRLYCVAGVVGQFISALDLKDAVGKARSEGKDVKVLSLVFRQTDISANCQTSMNLRSDLTRWGFIRREWNGRGLLFTKDLTVREEAPLGMPKPKPESKPLTAAEWAAKYKSEGLTVLPPSLQRDLEHEQRMKQDAETDLNRLLEIKKAEIERLQALKDSQAEKPCPQ